MSEDILSAVKWFAENFIQDRGYGTTIIKTIQGARGPICFVMRDNIRSRLGIDTRVVYYIMFKRDWFYSFGRIYKDRLPSQYVGKLGQTINMRVIRDAIEANHNDLIAVFAIVMPGERLYLANALQVHEFILKYDTMRIPRNEMEYEGSFPVDFLRRAENPITI